MNVRLLTPILISCAALAAAGETPAPVERFQRAVALEESEGKIKEALAVYRDLVKEPATPGGLRVRAELRVAACLERLGHVAKARALYTDLAKRGPTWAAVSKAASAALVRLKPRAAPVAATDRLPKGWVKKWCARTNSVDFLVKNADVRTLICELARLGNLDLVLSPEIAGQVTVELRGVSPRSAIEAIVSTVGDFATVEVERILQIVTKASLERRLVTRAYRLAPQAVDLDAKLRAVGPKDRRRAEAAVLAQRERHLKLAGVVQELLASSGISGSSAGFDPASETVFAHCDLAGHAAIARALEKELAPATVKAIAKDARVSVQLVDANVRRAVLDMAKAADSPLFMAGDFQGSVSAVLNQVPFPAALRAIVHVTGDFLVVDTPVGPSILSRSAGEVRLSYRRWALQGDPAAFWRQAHGSLWSGGKKRWPTHPLFYALSELVTGAGESGAAIQYDAGSHAVVSHLSADLASNLRRALVTAGYLSPKARPALKASGERLGVNVRALLQSVASQRKVNVIVSPEVAGQVDLILPAGEPPVLELLSKIVEACGDFSAVEVKPGLYRVAPRSFFERTLTSEVVPVPQAHLAPDELWAAATDLAIASGISGASVLRSQSRGGRWSLVITLPQQALKQLSDLVRASVPGPGLQRALAGQTMFLAGGSTGSGFQLLEVTARCAIKTRELATATLLGSGGAAVAGWSLRVTPHPSKGYVLSADKALDRRVLRIGR
ncbi:MAG: hypothetical protein JKY65_34110 [Planctomycetes bacterium]|nr:hypothetical protein [Planctomycetota bacterium]